jgi:sensor c-di-GMP phosphodiesterase-like protein
VERAALKNHWIKRAKRLAWFRRTQPGRFILVVLGAIAGIALGQIVGHALRLRVGRAELADYADRLLQSGVDLMNETNRSIDRVAGDGLPPCSDADIKFMRVQVYNSTHVRDLARIANHTIYCSTGVGRLSKPITFRPQDLTVGGAHIWLRITLTFSHETTGLSEERRGVSAIVNPEAYQTLDEGAKLYSGYIYDPVRGQAIQAFGHRLPLQSDEVVSGRPRERNGIFYQPRCDAAATICVVASEPRAGLLAQNRPLLYVLTAAGGLLGAALTAIALLLDQRRRSMEWQLRRALLRQSLTLVYQPVVDMRTDRIVSAEALVRWVNEEEEAIGPEIFVALAESKGFVRLITQLVLRRVVEELGDLLAEGRLRVTFNITAEDLNDRDFADKVGGALAPAGIAPSSIGLELTERSTADQTVAIAALARLKQAGYAIYIDDFGTGYSSLAYLHRLAADAVKIDRVFTQTVGTQSVTVSVVPQILEMASMLDLLVVAEGIETEEQASYFQTKDGMLGQGWLFGRPTSAAELRSLLASQD